MKSLCTTDVHVKTSDMYMVYIYIYKMRRGPRKCGNVPLTTLTAVCFSIFLCLLYIDPATFVNIKHMHVEFNNLNLLLSHRALVSSVLNYTSIVYSILNFQWKLWRGIVNIWRSPIPQHRCRRWNKYHHVQGSPNTPDKGFVSWLNMDVKASTFHPYGYHHPKLLQHEKT